MSRKITSVVLVVGLVAVLVLGYLFKGRINGIISQKMKYDAGEEVILSGKTWVDSLFNYNRNGKGYQYTLLEFKSTGCTICKQMEPELEKVRNFRKVKIQVEVLNVMNPNSQNVMKYFGISAVPTQLILDKQGNELFRNYGFISAEKLMANIR